MFKFYSLSSSSTGNCLLVESDESKILFDVGISMKKINTELEKINMSLSDISAIFITHEHTDHCKSLETINKKYNIPIYTNIETWETLNKIYTKINNDSKKIININSKIKFNDIYIKSFETNHNCSKSCGYTIEKSNQKIAIATDLGIVTDTVYNSLSKSTFIFIESNYDTNMLSVGKYPYQLKKRIASNIGHLSNLQCSEAICKLYKDNTKKFMIGHLSKENNFPELALQTIEGTLISNNIDLSDINIDVAQKECLSNIVELEN